MGGRYIKWTGKKNRKRGEERESVDMKEENEIGESKIGDSELKKCIDGDNVIELG